MPCRDDHCYCTNCGDPSCPATGGGKNCLLNKVESFDTSGALCDVLTLLENKFPEALKKVDKKTLKWWKDHESEEQEKIKQEALNKLTPRERRALGLK